MSDRGNPVKTHVSCALGSLAGLLGQAHAGQQLPAVQLAFFVPHPAKLPQSGTSSTEETPLFLLLVSRRIQQPRLEALLPSSGPLAPQRNPIRATADVIRAVVSRAHSSGRVRILGKGSVRQATSLFPQQSQRNHPLICRHFLALTYSHKPHTRRRTHTRHWRSLS